jgi:periplasmic protein TonB
MQARTPRPPAKREYRVNEQQQPEQELHLFVNADQRPRYRPPDGVPAQSRRTAREVILSVLLHLAIIAMIVAPPVFVTARFEADNRGAGGPGPAGGGGGGTRGTGGGRVEERLRYVQMSQPVPAPAPTPKPIEVPKIVPPPPKPEPPKEEPKPIPPPEPVAAAVDSSAAVATTASVVNGTGGGSGNDGSRGSGPGSGGGVGSGIGTGRGSGVGPGTGGGDATIYPPTVITLSILPLPVPNKVRPYKMVAYFDVDSTGVAKLLGFNPSKDDGYNKRIREMLLEMRFRPAVRGDGRPVRDTAKITAEAP